MKAWILSTSFIAAVLTLAALDLTAGEKYPIPNSAVPESVPRSMGVTIERLPIAFTKNMGQWDERMLFRTSAGGATIWITRDGLCYQFTRRLEREDASSFARGRDALGEPVFERERAAGGKFGHGPDSIEQLLIKASFVGANAAPNAVGLYEMEYKCNYFLGNDPAHWRTDVPNYATVIVKDIYPGIDVRYSGDGNGQAVYELLAVPGADAARIKLHYEGAEQISVDAEGRSIMRATWGHMIEAMEPRAQGSGLISPRSSARLVSTDAGGPGGANSYRAQSTAVALSYSTYLGGGDSDYGYGIAVDGGGNAYVTGVTYSANFPTQNPYQADQTNYDVFVTKLSSSGSSLVYSTYLGGTDGDGGWAIAVDAGGNAYVTGRAGRDFPTQNPYQPAYQGLDDVFVTKLSSSGSSLVYSTYLGGGDYDFGNGIAVDVSGNAYVTGQTLSPNFPAQNPYQAYQGGWDAFATKLSPAGNSLVYSTYLGGDASEFGLGIAIDGSGNSYVTGWTSSIDFPTQNPYQSALQGLDDVFVTKLSSSGSSLVYSTYLGGGDDDIGNGIAVDGSGNAYVTGQTLSPDFPTQNPYQSAHQGLDDVFVTKLSSSGSSLVYSTYLGGDAWDDGLGIAIDGSGNSYVTGWTSSIDFPTQNPYQAFQGEWDAFATKLSPAGNCLVCGTFLGGGERDFGFGIAVDGSGDAYVTGRTFSTDFPTLNPYQGTLQNIDAFVAKIAPPDQMPCLTPGLTFALKSGSSWDELKVSLTGAIDGREPVDGGPYDPRNPLCTITCLLSDRTCTCRGIIPGWANGLLIGVLSERAGSLYYLAAKKLENGRWVLENTSVWVILRIGASQFRGVSIPNLEVPIVIDSLSGNSDTIYTVVNLDEWFDNQQPILATYSIVNGSSPDLPGFLFGTSPIVFDSLADSTGSPFSTTPFTGVVQAIGSSHLLSDFFICGDPNGNVTINSSDIIYLVNYVFKSGEAPSPVEAGDVNADGSINASDIIYLVSYVFKSGPAPMCL